MSSQILKILLKNLFIFIYLSSYTSSIVLRKSFSQENINIILKDEYQQYKKVQKLSEEYIIGPGDIIFINYIGAPFLSSSFTINQEGKIDLPEINSIFVKGYTIKELEEFLTYKYNTYIIDPEVKISVIKYRPIQVYITGEVTTPGIYDFKASYLNNYFPGEYKNIPENRVVRTYQSALPFEFNRLDDVLRAANGITSYADLSKIVIVRKNSISKGGGKIKAELNFLSLLENGDLSQNVRIYDGDAIFVLKTNKNIKDQIINFNKSNLSPEYIEVFVVGNVDTISKGKIKVPRGSSLIDAIAASGGKKIFTGKIEFIRFNENNSKIRRLFNYDPSSPIKSKKNPILMQGDIINVQKSFIGNATEVINNIATPLSSSFFIYSVLSR